jgi:hypothetical protein
MVENRHGELLKKCRVRVMDRSQSPVVLIKINYSPCLHGLELYGLYLNLTRHR